MIPQTLGTLIAFLGLIAPGLAFELVRERKRPRITDSAFREASRIALSSFILSATSIVIQLILWAIWPHLSLDLEAWIKAGNAYLQGNATKVVGNLAFTTLFACLLGFLFALAISVSSQESSSHVTGSAWRHALRVARPRKAKAWVHVHLKDGTAFFGYLGSYSLADKPDEREILLKGVTLTTARFSSDGELENVDTIGERWESVVIPASQIAYIRVQYRDSNGNQVDSEERSRELQAKAQLLQSSKARNDEPPADVAQPTVVPESTAEPLLDRSSGGLIVDDGLGTA